MDPLSWIVIGICVFLHFFFSASETALASANKFKFQVKADDGSKTSKLVLKVCDDYDRILSALLIGSNIVAILASSVSTVAFYHLFEELDFATSYVSLISSVIISLLIYIFGDALAKTIARKIPDTISKIFVYPVYVFSIIFFPLSWCFDKLAVAFDKLFKVKEEESITADEFEDVIDDVTDDGVLEEETGEIIQSALEFADTNVKEVLTPREKIFALDINGLTNEKLFDVLETTSFSRIPIYKGTIDNIIGVLHVKIFFKQYMQKKDIRISKTLQKPYFVSSRIMIDDLFNGFKKRKTHIAFVRNNNMRVIGMVTMDDVLEELVGNIGETENKGGNK